MLSRSATRLLGCPLRPFSSRPAAADNIDYVAAKVKKEDLMTLRKRTGYSFVNCKKALVHFPDDLDAARKWLDKHAREQGWEKASKVGSRLAAEGLVGLATSGGVGAMVELNCETDFVARNAEFQSLVAASTLTALSLAANLPSASAQPLLAFEGHQLLDMQIPDFGIPGIPSSERLGDFLTFTLGKLGENMRIQRAACLAYNGPDVKVVGYAHPRPTGPPATGVTMGSFGTLVAIQRGELGPEDFPTETLGQQMGQQVIGMRPTSVGSPRTEEEEAAIKAAKESAAQAQIDKKKEVAAAADDEGEEGLIKEGEDATQLDVEQTELLKQDFLLHPSVSVAELLKSHNAQVLNFVRFECGETSKKDD